MDARFSDPVTTQARVVRDGLTFALVSPAVASIFFFPLWLAALSSLAQPTLVVPTPPREVTLFLDGLPGLEPRLSTGADGESADAPVEEAEAEAEAPTEAPDDDDALAEASPAETPTRTAPPRTRAPEPAAGEPEPVAEASDEVAPPDDAAPTGEGAVPGEAVAVALALAATSTDAEAEVRRRPRSSRAGRRGACGEGFPQIRQIGPDVWVVERDLIEWYASDRDRFDSLGYSRKYEEDGVKGWLIGGFGCRSPLWKAGLRSRDVIRAVNGKKTYNVIQLFGIWLTQRNKDAFTIEVLRRGRPVTLHYRLLEEPRDRRRR